MSETPPLAYFWGEDAFRIERAARTYAERVSPPGEVMEVWRVSLDDDAGDEGGSASTARRRARALDGIEQHLGMAPLFGAGTLVVVRQPAGLLAEKEARGRLLSLAATVPSGNALCVTDLIASGAKGPAAKGVLHDAIRDAGGAVQQFKTPGAGQLEPWLVKRAAELEFELEPAAARLLAERVGGHIREADVDRRRRTELANGELEKLALYRPGGSIAPEDVEALVTETIPGSTWAFLDAVGARAGSQATIAGRATPRRRHAAAGAGLTAPPPSARSDAGARAPRRRLHAAADRQGAEAAAVPRQEAQRAGPQLVTTRARGRPGRAAGAGPSLQGHRARRLDAAGLREDRRPHGPGLGRPPRSGREPLEVRPTLVGPGSHRAAVWLALLVTVLWSSSWVIIRWGLDDEALPPVMFAALRYGLAAIVLVGWLISREHGRRHEYRVSRGYIARLVVLGVVMYALTQGAIFVALDAQPAATTSLVLAMTPLFVAGGAAISLAEFPTRAQVTGVAFVAVGARLYFAGDLSATTTGLIAALVALAGNVAAALLGRSVNRAGELPAIAITAISMAIGAAALVFIAIGLEGIPQISLRGWLIIVWLAVVNTAFAFTLWNVTLQRLSAVESASINNTMLVQIALLAWLFLGEAPGAFGLLGIALVSAGVYLVQATNWMRAASSQVRTSKEGSSGEAPDH